MTFAIPERVVVVRPEVHETKDRHTLIVDRIAMKNVPIKFVGVPEVVVSLVDGDIAAGWVSLPPRKLSRGGRRRVLLVIDRAVGSATNDANRGRETSWLPSG